MVEHVNERGNRVVSSSGQRPSTRTPSGKHNVRTHRRTSPKGKKTPVRRHVRANTNGNGSGARRNVSAKKRYRAKAKAAISPKSARRNLRQAWRENRKGRNWHAIGLAAGGVAQLLAWLLVQSTFLLILAVAALFAALALVIDEVTTD